MNCGWLHMTIFICASVGESETSWAVRCAREHRWRLVQIKLRRESDWRLLLPLYCWLCSGPKLHCRARWSGQSELVSSSLHDGLSVNYSPYQPTNQPTLQVAGSTAFKIIACSRPSLRIRIFWGHHIDSITNTYTYGIFILCNTVLILLVK